PTSPITSPGPTTRSSPENSTRSPCPAARPLATSVALMRTPSLSGQTRSPPPPRPEPAGHHTRGPDRRDQPRPGPAPATVRAGSGAAGRGGNRARRSTSSMPARDAGQQDCEELVAWTRRAPPVVFWLLVTQ